MTIKSLGFEFIFTAFWLAMGFLMGMPTAANRELIDKAQVAIQQCQKDLPRSQVCELTAKVKESK